VRAHLGGLVLAEHRDFLVIVGVRDVVAPGYAQAVENPPRDTDVARVRFRFLLRHERRVAIAAGRVVGRVEAVIEIVVAQPVRVRAATFTRQADTVAPATYF
jgi:hypothetical protein